MVSMMVVGMAMAQTAPPPTETAVFYFDASGVVVALDICEGRRPPGGGPPCVSADLSDWTGSYDDGRSYEIILPSEPADGPWPNNGELLPIYGWTNCREDWDLQQSVCDWDVVDYYVPGCSMC